MGIIEDLWAAGEMPYRDGLYRPDGSGRMTGDLLTLDLADPALA